MRRTLKLLSLAALMAAAAACSDPVASISAAETTSSADEGECIAGGYLGSGNVVPCS